MSGGDFFILVEGEPHSPELAFLEIQITKIFEANDILYFPKVCEVGSSSAFNSVAKPFYRLSKAHKNVPVLAIIDSDYRVPSDKVNISDEQLIKNRNTKKLYWQRHEWENYLLSETQFIADFANQFPKKYNENKFFKNSDSLITKKNLDDFLKSYFKEIIKDEFFECLKFNLNTKIERYPSISKPDSFNEKSIDEIKEWFLSTANDRKVTIKPIKNNLFEEILTEYNWIKWLNNPESLSFDVAKNKLRGKEAIDKLFGHIKTQYQCRFDNEEFKSEILKHLPDTSAIITDLINILPRKLP
jgi:hypothetical protein